MHVCIFNKEKEDLKRPLETLLGARQLTDGGLGDTAARAVYKRYVCILQHSTPSNDAGPSAKAVYPATPRARDQRQMRGIKTSRHSFVHVSCHRRSTPRIWSLLPTSAGFTLVVVCCCFHFTIRMTGLIIIRQ